MRGLGSGSNSLDRETLIKWLPLVLSGASLGVALYSYNVARRQRQEVQEGIARLEQAINSVVKRDEDGAEEKDEDLHEVQAPIRKISDSMRYPSMSEGQLRYQLRLAQEEVERQKQEQSGARSSHMKFPTVSVPASRVGYGHISQIMQLDDANQAGNVHVCVVYYCL